MQSQRLRAHSASGSRVGASNNQHTDMTKLVYAAARLGLGEACWGSGQHCEVNIVTQCGGVTGDPRVHAPH